MTDWLRVASVLLAIFLIGCTERDRSDGALTVQCGPHIAATSKEEATPHPRQPSKCAFGIAMMCNACVYRPDGSLSHARSDLCGVCIGGSF